MSHDEPYRNLRHGHSASPSPLLQFHFLFLQPPQLPPSTPLFAISTDPDLTGSVAVDISSLPDLFMQPESTAVSQHTPPIDSSSVNLRTTQHGHDLDDAQVSGFLREETSDLADVSSMSTRESIHASLNDERSTPPYERVSPHVNAGSPPRQSNNAVVRVAFADQPETTLEAFPNGK